MQTYAYYYAVISDTTNGWCLGVQDTSDYVLDPTYVPITDADPNYMLKYYWPLPETVESFDDFQGSWYEDADHTIPWNP